MKNKRLEDIKPKDILYLIDNNYTFNKTELIYFGITFGQDLMELSKTEYEVTYILELMNRFFKINVKCPSAKIGDTIDMNEFDERKFLVTQPIEIDFVKVD